MTVKCVSTVILAPLSAFKGDQASRGQAAMGNPGTVVSDEFLGDHAVVIDRRNRIIASLSRGEVGGARR